MSGARWQPSGRRQTGGREDDREWGAPPLWRFEEWKSKDSPAQGGFPRGQLGGGRRGRTVQGHRNKRKWLALPRIEGSLALTGEQEFAVCVCGGVGSSDILIGASEKASQDML